MRAECGVHCGLRMDEEEENQNKILIKFNTLSRFVYSICHMNVNIGYRCVSHD